MKSVAVIGLKGGVGKTTTAVNLLASLAEMGFIVEGLDLDQTQGDFTEYASALGVGIVLRTAGRCASWIERAKATIGVINCPPNASREAKAALMVADLVIVPVTPSEDGWKSVERMLVVIAGARLANPKLQTLFLISNVQPPDAQAHEYERDLREQLPESSVFETSIPFSTYVQTASNARTSVLNHAPRSSIAKIYRNLAGEVQTRITKESHASHLIQA